MILSMKQGQQQKQKLTQEQSFFLDILKFNKEELTDYLEKEYQENPLIDFDRRIFNKEGVSFEEDLSDIENNAVKESLQDHLLQQTGFLSKGVPENIAEFLIYSLDRNGYLREESINEVIKFFPEYTEEQVEDFIRCMQQMEPTGVFARNLQECMVLQLQESESKYKMKCIQIVKNHIQLLADNKLPEISRLEPFTLKEVAEELGMHESTISRAISNKSVRFKKREIPLKYFFISKTVNGDSKDCVEERIKALIASEDKQHPLSDQKLSELMKKEGIVAARRTIAKYREQMGILPAAKRKVY